MVTKTLVKSFYTKVLVTCYERNGVKYVANQHGNYDVFEEEFEKEKRSRTVTPQSEEMAQVLREYKQQGGR